MAKSNKLYSAFAGREEEMMARISHMYYVKGMTQEEIGQEYMVSRFKIIRILEEAKAKGIIRIEILSPQGICLELEKKLKEIGLIDAIVAMPFDDSPASRMSAVCQSAASYLYYKLNGKKCFGLTWGRTVANTLSALSKLGPDRKDDLIVAPLMGGIGKQQFSVSSTNLVLEVARLYNAKAHFILSPCIVDTNKLRDYFVNEAGNAHTLELSRQADIALMGIGSNSRESGLVQSGLVSDKGMAELIAAGSVGNTCAHFYNIDGHECELYKGKVVGLTFDEIRRLPFKIGVATGPEKVDPIIGAIRGRLIDVLITDKMTTETLLRRIGEI